MKQTPFNIIFANGWSNLPDTFNLILTPGESQMLSFLMRWATYVQADRNNNGWFYCTTSTIEDRFYVSRKTQGRLFKKLRTKKYIKTRMHGNPPLRWIKIDIDKIGKDLNTAYDKWEAAHANKPPALPPPTTPEFAINGVGVPPLLGVGVPPL